MPRSTICLGFVLLLATSALAGCRTSTTTSPAKPMPAATSESTYTKPSAEQLRATLSPLQYEVTQRSATEPPFRNAYWDNHAAGIYVDVVTGEPLFSSADKFESGTGWPSFTRPIRAGAVVATEDATHGMTRTEVRSAKGDSHLGHVFDDGPGPTHMRYCINSASLRFVPASALAAEGYGAFEAAVTSAAPLAANTDNACALPPPGERAGCSTTLETAILEGRAPALAQVPGVLEVEPGVVGKTTATRVVYDPKVVSLEGLRDAWSKAAGRGSVLAEADFVAQP